MRDKDRCICCTHSATYKHYISLTLSPHAHTNVHRHTHAENESPLHLQHSDHSWALTFSHASNVFTKVQTGRTRLSLFLSCNPLVNKDADQNKKIKQQQGKKKKRSVLSFFFFHGDKPLNSSLFFSSLFPPLSRHFCFPSCPRCKENFWWVFRGMKYPKQTGFSREHNVSLIPHSTMRRGRKTFIVSRNTLTLFSFLDVTSEGLFRDKLQPIEQKSTFLTADWLV